MVQIIDTIIDPFIHFYNSISPAYQSFVTILLFSFLIALYSILVWRFYRFLARRDMLEINLRQYTSTRTPVYEKITSSLLFLLEYIVLTPIVVFVWFAIFSAFILILSEIENVSHIILIAASIIAAIRFTAYYNEDLSKDISKMFPFTLLVIFVLRPEFFSISKIALRVTRIPGFLMEILVYLMFIVLLEIFLRLVFMTELTVSEKPEEVVEGNQEEKQKLKK